MVDEVKKKGKFIVLEGIDGCGKGTQLHFLVKHIFDIDKAHDILVTREPTKKSRYGIEIRSRLKEEKDPYENASLMTELYVKDRMEHLRSQILPCIQAGVHVVCDRYDLSTYAYQQLQGISFEEIKELHEKNEILVPDLTIVFDVDPDIALSRRNTRGGDVEKFEASEFQKKLRQKYVELKERMPERNIMMIDAGDDVDSVFEKVKTCVDHFFSVD